MYVMMFVDDREKVAAKKSFLTLLGKASEKDYDFIFPTASCF
jgi:hypothetical protein